MIRLSAVIFDWAGTTVDHGSLAPVRALTELFRLRGITLSDADVRRDMGMFKRDHIRKIVTMPHVVEQWQKAHHVAPGENDVASLFVEFLPLQLEVLRRHAEVIAGVPEVVARLRRRRLQIGSTTGYTRSLLDVLIERAREQGYESDLAVCPDDVGGGRPQPWMCLRLALSFHVSATSAAVKVGDTVSDIEEARNAGMWAVGVAATGNEVGLSAADLAILSDEDRAISQGGGSQSNQPRLLQVALKISF